MLHLVFVLLSSAAGAESVEPPIEDGVAPPAPSNSPFEVDLTAHLVANGGLVVVMGIYQALIRDELEGGLTCEAPAGQPRCDPNDINAIDRSVVGLKNNDLLLGSDILAGVLILGALTGAAIDGWGSGSGTPGMDFLTDSVVIVEAALVATALAHVLKFAIRRPRPTQYAEVGGIGTVEHQLAFPSGHATAAAALAAAYTTTFWLRHPQSPWRWVVLAGTGSVAVVTGALRVAGGFHWPTDVIAGLSLGAATGFLVPYLLRRSDVDLVAAPMVGADGTRGLEVAWRF